MMSLIEVKEFDLIKKQYRYKLKSFNGSFASLLFAQFLGFLFSLGGSGGMSSSGSDGWSFSVSYYSGDIIIGFTIIWAFITGVTITTKAYRYDDFSFVTNRFTSNISNIMFLVTIGILGGVTAMLAGMLLKTVMFFRFGTEFIIGSHVTVSGLFIGILATCLYVLLFGALGYFCGMLAQVNRIFSFLLPMIFFGMLFLSPRFKALQEIFSFYFTEESLFLFTIKVLFTVVILFNSSIAVSNRLEAR